jgi:FtsH-binding integral membrane protein
MLHTTYLYLAVAVAAAMGGAWLGSHSETFLRALFGAGLLGWVAIMVVINMVPRMALSVAENHPRMAVPALGFHGFLSGLALAPLVFLGLAVSGQGTGEGGNLVSTAVVVTGAIFAAITLYIHLNKANFTVSNAVMAGLFGFALVCVPLSMFMESSILELLFSLAVGLLGAFQLAAGTSRIVNDKNFNSPALGALILFAGVFNTFTAVLRLLLAGVRR